MTQDLPLHQQGPAIDKAHLDRMTGGDSDLALEVLGLFKEQIELWSRLLQPDSNSADWAIAAHTVKGSARGIGAWQLGEICGQAEELANQVALTRDEKRQWLDAIKNELDLVGAEIAVIEHKAALNSLK